MPLLFFGKNLVRSQPSPKKQPSHTRPFDAIKAGTLALTLVFLSLFSFAWAIEFTQSYLDEIGKNYGEFAKRRLITWSKLSTENKSADDKKKLEAVNTFFNFIEYRKDLAHWGKEDYWATPLEFVVSGAGDCEDFAVAKYFTLLELGVPDEKLLIMGSLFWCF